MFFTLLTDRSNFVSIRWWDNYLNNDDKNQILTDVKRETDGSVIITDKQPSQDAVNTLIFTITKHFVGDPNQYKERALDVFVRTYVFLML